MILHPHISFIFRMSPTRLNYVNSELWALYLELEASLLNYGICVRTSFISEKERQDKTWKVSGNAVSL